MLGSHKLCQDAYATYLKQDTYCKCPLALTAHNFSTQKEKEGESLR